MMILRHEQPANLGSKYFVLTIYIVYTHRGIQGITFFFEEMKFKTLYVLF